MTLCRLLLLLLGFLTDSPVLLDLFLSSDISIHGTMAQLGNSDHVNNW